MTETIKQTDSVVLLFNYLGIYLCFIAYTYLNDYDCDRIVFFFSTQCEFLKLERVTWKYAFKSTTYIKRYFPEGDEQHSKEKWFCIANAYYVDYT